MLKELIRNFSIIAHIDHGKSTLADRLLLFTGAIDERKFQNQMLDDMDLERERGITIKASAVRIEYKSQDGKDYVLNFIDTPGHVDFTYEVEKSLKACEGALLVVDASQGVESQTVANFYLAIDNNLEILPVINKIDIAGIDIDHVKHQLKDIFNFKLEDVALVSAKEGLGIQEVLEKLIKFIPHPEGDDSAPLQALMFDLKFDIYKGIIIYVRIFNGTLRPGMHIKMMHSDKEYTIEEVGVFKPEAVKVGELCCGDVGYITCNVHDPHQVKVGDTITEVERPTAKPLEGYRQLKPLVFCGIYPVNSKDFMLLRESMEKLRLNDPSFVYTPETSQSFGHGFRGGFLGLLHMEIVQERLQREYNLNLILTTPNVSYRIVRRDETVFEIESPNDLPSSADVKRVEEPYLTVSIFSPVTALDAVMELAKRKRGIYKESVYVSDRMKVIFDIPLSEVIVDFNDMIKSATKGYGSIDYEFKGYLPSEISKLDILINDKVCDAFSCLVHKERAYEKGLALVSKLKELIPQQLFEVRIQAACDGRIISSAKVRSVGKNVTAKCYGGDITRKRKLWEKQKEGKKKLKQVGQVEIPQEAFLAALKL
ncbi:MAG TPA: translation elongation factor 4 [Candidatus Omnitrophota bacterium]|nr:translation elongation factor 4 [Candidatus Omnitrophota bacterium]HPD84034.1 translation elongation factor 4 [Candidatus Omnitrophota bacterium]HRZ02891.1 translation elongation factor 4 [Candidatus Omnitrophota bacterium]